MKKFFIILAVIFCQFVCLAHSEVISNEASPEKQATQNITGEVVSNTVETQPAQNVSENPYMSDELRNSIAKNSYEPSFMGAVLSLIAVLGLIYLTGFLYQRLIKLNTRITSKDKNQERVNEFKMVSCSPLGQNKFLHVVEINNQFLVLGSTPNSINLLREFSKDEVTRLNEKCKN